MLPGGLNSGRKLRHKGGLRYSGKEYANPFFAAKKNQYLKISAYRLPAKVKIILALCLFAALGGAWLLFYSPYFKINNLEINGQGMIPVAAVEKIAWQQVNDNLLVIFPQKNIFFFSKDKLERSLKNKYSFEKLIIEKKLAHTLTVAYEEKKYALIWSEDQKYYYADEAGEIIAETDPLEIGEKNYPLIENQSGQRISEQKISVAQADIAYALNIFRKFHDYKTTTDEIGKAGAVSVDLNEMFKIEKFIIDDELNTVKLKLTDGPTIYFNTEENIDRQINKLIIVKTEKIKEDFNKKIYIDLRIGDSIYYR